MTASLRELDGDEPTHSGPTAAELRFGGLLFSSGYSLNRVADWLGMDRRCLGPAAAAAGWQRRTASRRGDPLLPNLPVTVRCADCLARFGESLRRPPRPCPFCFSTCRVSRG